MNGLSLISVSKSFGATQALSNVSFDVYPGEVIALLGPSGCGKSTLLSLIAGLEFADSGSITWNDSSLQSVPPHKRGFGLMFQDFALFPHMNVEANVAFGLRIARLSHQAIENRTAQVLELVGLPGFAQRDVNTLSGGEQQRVALARALAPHPQLLMLDEPLGSLDRSLRERLVGDLGQILRQMQQTAIYVTHDQEEAFTLAERIIVMNKGQVEQVGTPQEIYNHPASPFVARFLEFTNLIKGEVYRKDSTSVVNTPVGEFPLAAPRFTGEVQVLIRPDNVQPGAGGPSIIQGTLIEKAFRGNWQRLTVLVNEEELTFDFPSYISLPVPGHAITLSIDPNQSIRLFPAT